LNDPPVARSDAQRLPRVVVFFSIMLPSRSLRASLRLLILFGVLLAGGLRADVWVLRNGDRLTGKLLEEDEETIEIQHPTLGVLRFARSALQTAIPAAVPVGPAPVGSAPAVAKTAEASAPTAPAAPAGPAVASVTTTQSAPRWKRQIELGLSVFSGTTEKTDLNARFQIDGRIRSDTFRGTARVLQTDLNDKTVADRQEGEFRWRHDFSGRLFAQTLTTYFSDGVRNIDTNVEQQVGGGYRFVDLRRHKMNVGLGASAQYLDREDATAGTALLGTLFQDYAFTFSDRLKLNQESSFQIASERLSATTVTGQQAEGNYRVKFNSSIQSKVTSQMSLNLRYEYDYDSTVADSRLRGDQRLITALGYTF